MEDKVEEDMVEDMVEDKVEEDMVEDSRLPCHQLSVGHRCCWLVRANISVCEKRHQTSGLLMG